MKDTTKTLWGMLLFILAMLLLFRLPAAAEETDSYNPPSYNALAAINDNVKQVLQGRSQTLSDLRRAEAGALWALHIASWFDWHYTELDAHGPHYLCDATWTYTGPRGTGNPCTWSEADPLWKNIAGTKFSFPAFVFVQGGLHVLGMQLCSKKESTCRFAIGVTSAGVDIEIHLIAKGASIYKAQQDAPAP